MSQESTQANISLPGLESTRFDMMSAEVRIAQGGPNLEHPLLIIEGDQSQFKHSFQNGKLDIQETGDDKLIVSSSGKFRGFFSKGSRVGSISSSNGSITINGIRVSGGENSVRVMSVNAPIGRIVLEVPAKHLASHAVETMSGDIELKEINSKELKIKTMSGSIALLGAEVETVKVETMSGDVNAENVTSKSTVKIKTMSGDIEILNGHAPEWSLSTMSGNIDTHNLEGSVSPSSMSGRVKIK